MSKVIAVPGRGCLWPFSRRFEVSVRRTPEKLLRAAVLWSVSGAMLIEARGVASDSVNRDLSSQFEPTPVFLPHTPFWMYVPSPPRPHELVRQAQALADVAYAKGQKRLAARYLVLATEVYQAEQPDAWGQLKKAERAAEADGDSLNVGLSNLVEGYRAYRSGDRLLSEAHLTKSASIFVSQHAQAPLLRAISLECLLKLPAPGNESFLRGKVLHENSTAQVDETSADQDNISQDLLSARWKEALARLGGQPEDTSWESWIQLFDGYQYYAVADKAEAEATWRRLA